MDINECTDGSNNCQQLCVNFPGGFRCECNLGFQLNADQATCSGEVFIRGSSYSSRIAGLV